MINNLNVVVPYLERESYYLPILLPTSDLTTDFKLDANLIGLNVVIVAAGSVISGPFVGILMDRFGRKGGS